MTTRSFKSGPLALKIVSTLPVLSRAHLLDRDGLLTSDAVSPDTLPSGHPLTLRILGRGKGAFPPSTSLREPVGSGLRVRGNEFLCLGAPNPQPSCFVSAVAPPQTAVREGRRGQAKRVALG